MRDWWMLMLSGLLCIPLSANAANPPLAVVDQKHVLVPFGGRLQLTDVENGKRESDIAGDGAATSFDGHQLLAVRAGNRGNTFLDIYAIDRGLLRLLASQEVSQRVFTFVQSNYADRPFAIELSPDASGKGYSVLLVRVDSTGKDAEKQWRVSLEPLCPGVTSPVFPWRFADDEEGLWCGRLEGKEMREVAIASGADKAGVVDPESLYFAVVRDRKITQMHSVSSYGVTRIVAFQNGRVLYRGKQHGLEGQRYWEYDLSTRASTESKLLSAFGSEVLAIAPDWDQAVMLDAESRIDVQGRSLPDKFVVKLLRDGRASVAMGEFDTEEDILGAAFAGQSVVLATRRELLVFDGSRINRYPMLVP